MVNFLKKHIAVVVASAEDGTTKFKLARSIKDAIKEKWGPTFAWNVIVASTPEGKEGNDVWGSVITVVENKDLKLQLGDKLYFEIWKGRSN